MRLSQLYGQGGLGAAARHGAEPGLGLHAGPDAPLAQLLSAVSPRRSLTLGQVAVDDKTKEITAIPTHLAELHLEGWVVTMDALLTQQKLAQAIVDAGGDSLRIVKENQPTWRADLAIAFADQWWWSAPARRRRRTIAATTGWNGAT